MKRDTQRYRKKLLAMRDRLAGEIDSLAATVASNAQAVGEHDRAVSEAVDKEIVLECAEEGIWKNVIDALKRLDDGTFGMCQTCHKPIAAERLDAVPYTANCIKCERILES
jgi:RNA polymerase-binding protein DksA